MAQRNLRNLLTVLSIGVGSYVGLNTWRYDGGKVEKVPKVLSVGPYVDLRESRREQRRENPYQSQRSNREDGFSGNFYNDVYELVKKHEGVRSRVYLDTRGKATVGVGLNLDSSSGRRVLERHGINFDDVYHGRTSLNERQIDELYRDSLDVAIGDAKAYVGEDVFERLDEKAKVVISDMSYALGRRRLSGFKRLRSALRQQPPNYEEAAREIRDSKWYRNRNLRRRVEELARIMESIDH